MFFFFSIPRYSCDTHTLTHTHTHTTWICIIQRTVCRKDGARVDSSDRERLADACAKVTSPKILITHGVQGAIETVRTNCLSLSYYFFF